MGIANDLALLTEQQIKQLASDMLEAAFIIETADLSNDKKDPRQTFRIRKNQHRLGAMHRIYSLLANADNAALLRMSKSLSELI